MNPPRFDRFSQPDYLQRIGRGRVTKMLSPFAPELLGLGIALPAAALPDDLFFQVLATLARQADGVSAPLLDAMTAIEVIEDVFPDEVPAAPCPLVVTELRLRLGVKSRPILFSPAADPGLLDGGMTGLRIENGGHLTPALPSSGGEGGVGAVNGGLKLAEGAVPYFVVSVAESRPSKEDGGSRMENGVTEVETARGVLADGHQPRPTRAVRFKFRQKGSVCVVKFNGLPKFHLANTDGAKYLDHLLHRPNEVIRAFDLERAVKPDKAAAREANSIQRAADARTQREARAELLELEAELAEAEAEGLTEKVERLSLEIAQIKKLTGKPSLLTSDTGERARNNVRKAIGKVIAKLRKGSAAEQAFALHLTQSISLGYDVVYTSSAGKIWN